MELYNTFTAAWIVTGVDSGKEQLDKVNKFNNDETTEKRIFLIETYIPKRCRHPEKSVHFVSKDCKHCMIFLFVQRIPEKLKQSLKAKIFL